jgi:signal transduction histidine kinase
MKIATKVITGYGVLLALILALPALEFFVILRLQRNNQDLSQLNVKASIAALEVSSDLEGLRDHANAYFLFRDKPYLDSVNTFIEAVESKVEIYNKYAKSGEEKAIGTELNEGWQAFRNSLRNKMHLLDADGIRELPAALDDQLKELNRKSELASEATRRAIDSEVAASSRTVKRTVFITSCVTALAFITAAVVSFFLIRSITTPLRHLTVGTRRITEGQFDYRLDTSSRDEFGELGRDFNMMTQRLNELDQMKKDFVSHVSHELKAPLASIYETLQLMLEELPGPLTAKQKRLVEINLICARRLSSMLGNLLDLSRMDAGMMEYQLRPNDAVALTLTAMEEYEPHAREKSLRLVAALPELPLPVHCDGDRIIQVIGNVLGNAIKFSPTGGRIEIRAQALPALPRDLPESCRSRLALHSGNGSYVSISIADSGPGIDREQKEKIFKKFKQLPQDKVFTGKGVGLGLAISRTIMLAHQGAIWVEDNPGGGSIFYLLLPSGTEDSGITHSESAPI